MPQDAAFSWLKKHTHVIPALDYYHKQASISLARKTSTLADLADIIALDPGMSLALYAQVNGKLDRLGRQRVTTIHAALGLVGQGAISKFVRGQKKLSDVCPEAAIQQAYLQLVSRTHHAMSQTLEYLNIQGIKPDKELRSATLFQFLGELYACLFDFPAYIAYRVNPGFPVTTPVSAKSVFNFEFDHLARLLAKKHNLPDMVLESLTINPQTGRKARTIQLAGNIAQQVEIGWNGPTLQPALDITASFLDLDTVEFRKTVQTIAIKAARSFPFDDVFPAASGIILQPQTLSAIAAEKTLKAGQTMVEKPVPRPGYKSIIQASLKTQNVNQAQLLSLLLNDLHKSLGFSQVALLLLTADKKTLVTRLTKGFPENSDFLNLSLDANQNRLVKSLLGKSQVLSINQSNLEKFLPLLPGNLYIKDISEEFILMSLFVSDKPVGLIYCNLTNAPHKLDEKTLSLFKSNVLMTSKALTFLANRKKTVAA